MSPLRPLEEIERDHGVFAREYIRHGTPLSRLLADIPAFIEAQKQARVDQDTLVNRLIETEKDLRMSHDGWMGEAQRRVQVESDLARVTAERDALRTMVRRFLISCAERAARHHFGHEAVHRALLADAERLLKEKA